MSGRPGVFILSLDTEIAWGTFYSGGLRRYARHFNADRPTVKRLVALLDRYEVPATWAFVGHLLLDHCERSPDGTTHPEVLRPRYRWYPHDWHHCDPATDVQRDPWWYGPDLLEMVLNAEIRHEIGTHTFSHIIVDDPDCSREIFRSQLEACVDLHRRFDLTIDSIVYPRNAVAFLDVLPEFGVTAYRGVRIPWYVDLGRRLHRAARVLDRFAGFTPPTYSLAGCAEGPLINLPASMSYLSRDGLRRVIPVGSRVLQGKRGLARAAERGELFHLWFHPFNLAGDPGLFTGLEEILRFACALRASGSLCIATMRQAADLVRRGKLAGV